MRYLLLFFFLFVAVSLQAQAKTISIPTYRNGDTALWYQWKAAKSLFGLTDLRSEKDTFHYRFDTGDQLVDLWTADNRCFQGCIYSYIHSYEAWNMRTQSRKPSTFYYSGRKIDTATARVAFALLRSADSIPSQDSIPGWRSGCDGVTYCIERSTPDRYSFAYYWTPSVYAGHIPEARAIKELAEKLSAVLDLEGARSDFFATLSPGSYTNGYVVMTRLTPRQAKRWKRYEKREQRKEHAH